MYGHAVTYVGEYFSYHINFFYMNWKSRYPRKKKEDFRFEDHNQNQFTKKKGSTKSKSIDKNRSEDTNDKIFDCCSIFPSISAERNPHFPE